ncbi:hypothetical protein EJ03DRAFT_59305 [Teratosphaeria nubilosa]|uniref:Uncharacterized protein n=1 Tax=Teratosphaeria nubilosa TaxID=161662 RepID=A0A6G1LCH0_9PEZI|nr:hypothetical protein EJ03DRAFT_59305 [Teratosphaeria nubilosa]
MCSPAIGLLPWLRGSYGKSVSTGRGCTPVPEVESGVLGASARGVGLPDRRVPRTLYVRSGLRLVESRAGGEVAQTTGPSRDCHMYTPDALLPFQSQSDL